jgi:hypothetical protein
MKIDFIFIRGVLIAGNLFLIAFDYAQREITQLQICAIECILMAFLMMGLQWHVYKKWEEHKLPFKMKDVKANYLFKQLRYPNELTNLQQYLAGEEDVEPEWEKYLPFYSFPEIFLDNKLEELLNVFGKRQCKSCIELPTGTELEEDPR